LTWFLNQTSFNTALIKKWLKALLIGLAELEYVWNQKPHHFSKEDLAESRNVLTGSLSSFEDIYNKSTIGSSQRTLLERRITVVELALQAIDDIRP